MHDLFVSLIRSILSFFLNSNISYDTISNNIKGIASSLGIGTTASAVIAFVIIRRIRSMIFRWIITLAILGIGAFLVIKFVIPHLL